MKIRVLHVIDHLGYGGAPVVVKNIAEKLDAEQIETLICALRTNPEPLPVKAKIISLTYHKYNPLAFFAIARLCKQHNINIVHAHLQKSVICSLLAGFICNAKIIIHEHGPIFRRGTGCIYRFLLKLLAKKASTIIANSKASIEALKQTAQFDEQPAYVVTNFVDFTRFDHTIYNRQKARNELGITEDKKVIGFVGRLDTCKGVDLLIKAAAMLCKKDLLFHFVIVGHGTQRKKLEQLVLQLGLKENVTFTGLHKNPAEIITAFDIAVVPSRREAFGIVAIEFMRMKIPVIASPVGGLLEVIKHNETGIFLENLSADSIARAVYSLTQDNSLREQIIENAELASRKFDGTEQIKQIADIYKKLCP
ncbi:MAG: glycosyltransferase family 4 protein [Sedimentisphaerales bacterium]|nr:glycosyltransferase family 4 protein [Sedimentisphaerales bacterium]